MTVTTGKPSGIPRRANRIRALAVSLAADRRRLEVARQAVSDRIGYMVAAVIGAVVYARYGQRGVEVLAALYALSAFFSYRKFKRVSATSLTSLTG